jgi:mRNA interferase MazF
VVEMSNLTLQEQLEVFKRTTFVEENKDSNITKIEINIETQDYKDRNIFENKIYSKSVHSNFEKEIAVNNINEHKEIRKPKRREIWYVNFGQKKGNLQSNIRPCLVSSNELSNLYSNIINVFPITSKLNKAKIPVHVEIENFGLKEKSLILTEQITTIDIRYDLLYYIGTVDELTMKKVDVARNIQLGDLKPKSPLERLDKSIQNIINEKLEDIKSVERTITNIKRESLVKHLMDEREANLLSLERICKKYNLDYKDYYVMYRKEEEKIVI